MGMRSRPTTTRQNGTAIRQLRRQTGTRTREFAESVSIAAPTLTNIENGNAQGSWELLHRIAGALDVEIVEILSDHGRTEMERATKAGAA
jgi:transcriptional regulator with XRE-family HTH domain